MARKVTKESEGFYKVLPRRLRELMAEHEGTHDDLAAILGVQRQTVTNYCNGVSSPTWESLVLIAGYFNTSVDYLLGRTEARNPDRADIRIICDYTGLSQKAVEYFHWESQDPETMPILNQLFEARIEDLHRLAVTIMLVNKTHSAIPKHHIISPCPETEEGKEEYKQQTELGNVYLPPREAANFFRQKVEREFGGLLEKTILREELD